MNIKNLRYYLLGIMMALLAGCAADPNIESAKLNLTVLDFEAVIESAERAIEANPENPDGYYYKGVGLAQLAFDMNPAERKEYYREARENLVKARELYESQDISSDESRELPNFILDIWGTEHNAGIELLSDDFISTEEDSLKLSEIHLTNAVTMNPDSVQTYSILYEVNYLLGDLSSAIANAEYVVFDLQSDDLYNYYRLTYFYQENDEFDKAVSLLNDARERYPEEIEIVQELANLYLTQGDTDQALETVQTLIDADPSNPQYRLVYGTQVYQLVLNMDDEMSGYYDELFEINQEIRNEARKPNPDMARIQALDDKSDEILVQIDELQVEIDRFSDRAEEELQAARELEPNNAVTYATLGIIYQNRAAALFERRNATEDFDEAERLDKQAREMLHEAIPYYERAAEIEPDDVENWRALFRIYTTLGMTEEAEHAQERGNI